MKRNQLQRAVDEQHRRESLHTAKVLGFKEGELPTGCCLVPVKFWKDQELKMAWVQGFEEARSMRMSRLIEAVIREWMESYIKAMKNFAVGKECCERCDGEGYIVPQWEDHVCPRCNGACLVDPILNGGAA